MSKLFTTATYFHKKEIRKYLIETLIACRLRLSRTNKLNEPINEINTKVRDFIQIRAIYISTYILTYISCINNYAITLIIIYKK